MWQPTTLCTALGCDLLKSAQKRCSYSFCVSRCLRGGAGMSSPTTLDPSSNNKITFILITLSAIPLVGNLFFRWLRVVNVRQTILYLLILCIRHEHDGMFRAIHIACELECSQDDGCTNDELNAPSSRLPYPQSYARIHREGLTLRY